MRTDQEAGAGPEHCADQPALPAKDPERYRTLRPELFNLTALQDSGPLLRQLPTQASSP